MGLKEELIDDQDILFDVTDLAEVITFTTVKNRTVFENQLAFIEENNTGLIMQDGLESNKSESTITIKRSFYDLIVIDNSNLFGCRIKRASDNREWEVQREIRKDEIAAVFICLRASFNKGKAQ